MKQKATVGYSTEAIVKVLDGVTNSQVDVTGTTKPLLQCITSGVLRGAVAMVGCNNPSVLHLVYFVVQLLWLDVTTREFVLT